MAVNVRPLGDRVLVQTLEEAEVKKGGIIIPDTAKEKPQEGKVVALGTGKRDEDGKTIPFVVKAVALAAILALMGHFLLGKLVWFTVDLFQRIPHLIG